MRRTDAIAAGANTCLFSATDWRWLPFSFSPILVRRALIYPEAILSSGPGISPLTTCMTCIKHYLLALLSAPSAPWPVFPLLPSHSPRPIPQPLTFTLRTSVPCLRPSCTFSFIGRHSLRPLFFCCFKVRSIVNAYSPIGSFSGISHSRLKSKTGGVFWDGKALMPFAVATTMITIAEISIGKLFMTTISECRFSRSGRGPYIWVRRIQAKLNHQI